MTYKLTEYVGLTLLIFACMFITWALFTLVFDLKQASEDRQVAHESCVNITKTLEQYHECKRLKMDALRFERLKADG